MRDLAERIEDTETPSERANKGFPDKLLRLQNCKDANIQKRKIKIVRFEITLSLEKSKITFWMTKLSGKPPSGENMHFSPSCSWTNDWDGETDYNDKETIHLLGSYLFKYRTSVSAKDAYHEPIEVLDHYIKK